MNNAKTEFILFGSRHQLQKCTTESLSAHREEISCSNCIKYLGTWMDQEMSFRQHILNKCRVAMLNIQQIKLIRNILNEDTAHTLVLGLVMSHLDYCNAIFYGLPGVDLKRLQRVQNAAAKLVLNKSCRDSVTKCLFCLHWLPIKSRIDYKILTLTYTERAVRQDGLRSAEMVNMLEAPSLSAKHLVQDPPKVWHLTCGTIYQMKLEAYRHIKSLRSQLRPTFSKVYMNSHRHP